jgi:hypothetical protein
LLVCRPQSAGARVAGVAAPPRLTSEFCTRRSVLCPRTSQAEVARVVPVGAVLAVARVRARVARARVQARVARARVQARVARVPVVRVPVARARVAREPMVRVGTRDHAEGPGALAGSPVALAASLAALLAGASVGRAASTTAIDAAGRVWPPGSRSSLSHGSPKA